MNKEHLSRIPQNAVPESIDKVVSVQVFKRTSLNGDEIDSTSLEKYVGKLEGYVFSYGRFIFKVSGMELRNVNLSTHVVEVYLADELKKV